MDQQLNSTWKNRICSTESYSRNLFQFFKKKRKNLPLLEIVQRNKIFTVFELFIVEKYLSNFLKITSNWLTEASLLPCNLKELSWFQIVVLISQIFNVFLLNVSICFRFVSKNLKPNFELSSNFLTIFVMNIGRQILSIGLVHISWTLSGWFPSGGD